MKNILLVTSSPRGELSHSTKLANELAIQIGGALTVRELWREPFTVIDPSYVHAVFTPEENRTPEQKAALHNSDVLIGELQAADVVVIGAAMINFGMPASLKTWIDLITRAGVTFRYGESGPEGLLTGKKLVLVLASGGVYSSGPMAAVDHLSSGISSILGLLGFKDIETIWIEGTSMGPDSVERALKEANERTREVVASVR